MWEYPYKIRTFFKNTWKYDFGSALAHDWERTKEYNLKSLDRIVENTALTIGLTVGISLVLYSIYKEKKSRKDLEVM